MNEAFREQVASLPAQFEHEPSPVGGLPVGGRLLIGGLGGSGLAGEFLAGKQQDTRDVVVVRDEFLPRLRGTDDVFLAVSYSGETSETLSLWNEAGERGLPRAAVASGGRLLALAKEEGLPHCPVPAGLAPRSALGYLLRACWSLSGVSTEPDWPGIATHLRHVAATWGGAGGAPSRADDLASRMEGTLPAVVAVDPAYAVVVRRWLADLAENAKVPALRWDLPEASHNALMTVAKDAPKNLPITLFALGVPGREASRKRWKATLAVIESHGAKPVCVDEPHSDPWIRALGLAYVGDWASVFLADRLGVDAARLSIMNDLKRRLAGKET